MTAQRKQKEKKFVLILIENVFLQKRFKYSIYSNQKSFEKRTLNKLSNQEVQQLRNSKKSCKCCSTWYSHIGSFYIKGPVINIIIKKTNTILRKILVF